MEVIASKVPLGRGGLGKYFYHIAEDSYKNGVLDCYYSTAVSDEIPRGIKAPVFPTRFLFRYTPLRFNSAWRVYLESEFFDRGVAKILKPSYTFIGFDGQSLHCFRKARRLGYHTLKLASATSHVANILRQHKIACELFPFESGWLNKALYKKILLEYESADFIYVISNYALESFVREGISSAKLVRLELSPSPEYRPPAQKPEDGIFRIAYSGILSTHKGIPVLIEAFLRLSIKNSELYLLGNSGSPGMKAYLQRQIKRDPRIKIIPEEPLRYLCKCDVYVHPSFQDGLGYAPLEALACGIPVIVTEDTGMKEYVKEGINGYIVPTGKWESILERLEYIYKHPLKF